MISRKEANLKDRISINHQKLQMFMLCLRPIYASMTFNCHWCWIKSALRKFHSRKCTCYQGLRYISIRTRKSRYITIRFSEAIPTPNKYEYFLIHQFKGQDMQTFMCKIVCIFLIIRCFTYVLGAQRIISLRRFFWAPTTYALICSVLYSLPVMFWFRNKKINFQYTLLSGGLAPRL